MSDPEMPERIVLAIRPHSDEEFLTVDCDEFDEPVTHSLKEIAEQLAALDVEPPTDEDGGNGR